MPMASSESVLHAGFISLVTGETAADTTVDAARQWADIYTHYAIVGGIPASPKKNALAAALTLAFNPFLNGGAQALIYQALTVFWLGLAVPAQSGVVTAFVPTVPIVVVVPENVTPNQHAKALADTIHLLTMTGVFVTVPPGVVVPIV